ncbi:phosphoglycerate kinase [Hwanghaeella grinnelliae]|uniref:Phosphoglycerate kinase n=1 Tax=Hwanghaeella grinnelliae TaxID=2500179 RepID=A0A437QU08_9PROT|nr:phosphoglycerate kinase [Hwanghaeella grinnelliae]RVU37992.1 phosphoglycerate kinase [Hwanghaeella grinnelliae]
MAFKTLDDLSVSGKVVLVRGDLNVPMDGNKVSDTTRIDRLVPTVRDLLEKGASVVLMSHFGRPKGKKVGSMSLRPVTEALQSILGRDVTFAEDCVGESASEAIAKAGPGGVTLLENLRFHPGEEEDDTGFAKQLAALGDVYVNDAFSAAHRAHASTHALAKLLPAAAGRNMQAELEALDAALGSPQRPVAAIVGGAKVSSKLKVLENLVSRVDVLIIGGGMANTFLLAKGVSVGKSLCEADLAQTAREIIVRAEAAGCTIALPTDASIAPEFAPTDDAEVVPIDAVPEDQMILDVGPASAVELSAKLESCRTLVWNGPMGAFEIKPFDQGTVALAQTAARLTKAGSLVSIAGGGDTVAALNHAGVVDDFTYVSTAGGAFLEWMEGRELPGVAALEAAAAN